MFWKKSILAKLLVGIIIPAILIFVLSAILILTGVNKNLTFVTESDLMANSRAASYQVSDYFTKYTELVEQIGCNESVLELLRETSVSGTSGEANAYEMAGKSLDNILASDESISLVWTADFDSGDSVRSGGVIRGKMTDYDITSRSWYEQTLNNEEIFITEPYEDSTTGQMVASIIKPIFSEGKKIGLVAIDITIDSLNKMMSEYKLGKTGFLFLTTDINTIIYHPDSEMIGLNVTDLSLSDNIKSALVDNSEGSYVYESNNSSVHGYFSLVGNTGWKVLTGLPEKEFYEGYNKIKITILSIFAIGLAILTILIILIAMGIVRPLKKLKISAVKIADGNLDVDVAVDVVDEVGEVSAAIERTVIRLKEYIEYIEEISSVLGEIAVGNFNCELKLTYVGEFSRLKEEINNICGSLSYTLGQINEAADEVDSGSEQLSLGAQELSQGATDQASSIEELSATIYEISDQVSGTAKNAQNANLLSDEARKEVDLCNRQMIDLNLAMSEISNASSEIAKIIKTIEDIATQTNLLSLNAAIEAARAGEAGKGFAVVATEVQNLASKSAEAAKNTTTLIEHTLFAVKNGETLASDTANSLEKVVVSAKSVTDTIQWITNATEEQARSIEQVTIGIDQVASVIQTNSETAEQSASASEQLSAQSQMLKELIGKFQLKH